MKLGLGLGLGTQQVVSNKFYEAFTQLQSDNILSYLGSGYEWNDLNQNNNFYIGSNELGAGGPDYDTGLKAFTWNATNNLMQSQLSADAIACINDAHRTDNAGALTIVVKFNIGIKTSNHYLIGNANVGIGPEQGFGIRINNNGSVAFLANGDSSYIARNPCAAGTIVDNTDYIFIIGWDVNSNQGVVYVNSAVPSSWTPSLATATSDPIEKLTIGNVPDASKGMPTGSTISDVMIFDYLIDDALALKIVDYLS